MEILIISLAVLIMAIFWIGVIKRKLSDERPKNNEPVKKTAAPEQTAVRAAEPKHTGQTSSGGSEFIINNGTLVKYLGKGGDVVIPPEVTRIDYKAFSNCESLSDIQINGTVFIDFVFHDNEEHDVQIINRILSAMKLSGCSVENCEGYFETRREKDGNGRVLRESYRYGFNELSLKCSKDTQEAFVYTLDTAAYPGKNEYDSESFEIKWTKEHPDRVVRLLSYIKYDDGCAFILLHHIKQTNMTEPETKAPENKKPNSTDYELLFRHLFRHSRDYERKKISDWNSDDLKSYREDLSKDSATIHPGEVYGNEWRRYV